MDHEQAVALLPEFYDGTLGDEARAALERHLEQCADCRRLAGAYAAMDSVLREHPPSHEIVALAIGEAIPAERRQRVEHHVRDCAGCSDEVARTRQAHARASGASGFASSIARGWSRTPRYAALAASLLLIVLALDDARLRQRPAGDAHVGGAVELKVLSSSTRAPGESETIRIGANQPYVPIALEVDRVATMAVEGDVRFEIRSENDEVIWSLSLPAERVQRDIRETGLVTLLVPASTLVAGSHVLVVTAADVEVLKAAFRIER